ncbi:hypothetical protein [Saccharopolyspora kobensis]|uniref:hypothetical protein n=1 Tax=Saccharopolyspora kobensis TaxID=146035 RepID=UPI0033265F77
MTWAARAGIMWGVADQHEPEPGSNLPDKSRPADIVDAEVVDGDLVAAPTPAKPAQPADDAEFREFQEFQRFKQFREWQQAQGGDLAVPPPTGAQPAEQPKKPWWKTALGLLRYKFVRRLIYLLVLLLLLNYAYDYYFGSSSGGGNVTEGGGSALEDAIPVVATSPKQAVRSVYNGLRSDSPETACTLFSAEGQHQFAREHSAPNCTAAAQQVNSQITDPGAYANPKFGQDVIYGDPSAAEVLVLHCRVQVTGGPLLGTFKLSRQTDGSWEISAYSFQTSACPN